MWRQAYEQCSKDEADITVTTIAGMDARKEFLQETALQALLNYFDEVAVKPEIEKLYLEVMGTIFKAKESNREQEFGKLKGNLARAEKKLASLEEK